MGTFYRASKPDAEPFVQLGDEVEVDSIVGVIDSMRVTNEIHAETSGRVKEILVKNGQVVEFGQPLLLIEKK